MVKPILITTPKVFADSRGRFEELYNDQIALIAGQTVAQVNFALNTRCGTLRGLHYQHPRPMAKLVICVKGVICDVAVDVRRGSPTFKQNWTYTLHSGDKQRFWIPRGFAHGYMALTDGAELVYLTDTLFDPDGDWNIRWDDPDLHIPWPMQPGETILSVRDRGAPLLRDIPEERLPLYENCLQ